ncbi:MAG: discoidin domain-containing protein [Tannerella sp.]|jgi:hypothetical protein|nr:discoidin domain-containing protein [Tannerella sp.]
MKINILLAVNIICGIVFFNSCGEPYSKNIELENFMYISISGAIDKTIENTVDLDKAASYKLSVSYGGTTNYNQGEILAEISADNSLVDAYNTENGTSYLPLPAGTYSFDKSSVVIADGSRISDYITLEINSPRIDFSKEYILPVSIKSVTGGKIPLNEDLKTVYYIIKGDLITTPETDKWTVAESSSVWQSGYKVENVYDGLRNTYWHSDLSGMPQWFAINMNGNNLIEGFSWINRQDQDQHALPKHVKFEVSMDGTNWTEVLDVPELPNSRGQQVLELSNKVVARYFKVTVLSNWADAPYSYVAEVGTWAGEKPSGDYDWQRSTWTVVDFKSEWNATTWAVARIFDGDKSTTWHSEPFDASKNGMPQWFVVDMMEERPAIKGFLIWNRQDDHGHEPKNVVFSVSNDNENWTTILDLAEMSNDYSKELDYKTTTSKTGRYLKVEVKTNWANGSWTYFAEITPY